jgi:two-component system, OmpR family, sensor histidine kinase BaeS
MPKRDTPDVLIDDSQEQPAPAEQPSANNGNGRKRPHAFRRRLAFAFATVAAVTALLAGALLSSAWNYQFNAYVHDNLEDAAHGIATIIAQTYPTYGFTYGTLERIPMVGVTSSVGVQVVDAKNEVVYDEASMRAHMQAAIQNQTTPQVPQVQKPTLILQPSGDVVTAPITVAGKTVGTVRVWAYGTKALLTERDLQFRRGSLMALAIAALVAVAFAAVAGTWYAGRLVRPIMRITETAEALQNGSHDARTGLDSSDEIGYLGKTFDAMADSIEADREMERRLTADVAHELRTPLQAIQATVEAMQDGVLPADEERLGIVREETRRLSRLTDGILELTRLERGTTAFDMRRIDVAGPVHMAVDSLAPLIETCALTLTHDIAEHIYIKGDRDRLQQAVGNLLSNAARYTPADGSVLVTLRRDGDEAVIEVADTGVGIADEDMQRVFSRFWRADNARATATGGSGIGLAVTKEIVERHAGSISVAHRKDVDGTVFTIRLPLA